MPVAGRYPKKASGEWYSHLQLRAREINTPKLIVLPAQLGEHQWLVQRMPHRFSY